MDKDIEWIYPMNNNKRARVYTCDRIDDFVIGWAQYTENIHLNWIHIYNPMICVLRCLFTPSGSVFDGPRTERSRRASDPSEMEWKGLGRLTHQPIKLPSTDYLVTFTSYPYRTMMVGKGDLFDFATIFTRMTARSCTGNRASLQWK